MKFYLDTNLCIYFLKGTYPALKEKLLSHTPDSIVVPSLVRAELFYGARKSIRREENLEKIERFLFPFGTAVFDDVAAGVYGELRQKLEQKGTPIGPNDLIIAATVMANNGTLVTHNTGEFSGVEGLEVEDWTIRAD